MQSQFCENGCSQPVPDIEMYLVNLRHRKPGGECSLHNLSTSSNPGSQQGSMERRMSLPPGFGRPASSQGSTSPMPQGAYTPSETNINPALAAASHGHSYPPTH